MTTRRKFLKTSLAASAGFLMLSKLGIRRAFASTLLDPTRLTKYLDPLPIPGVMRPSRLLDDVSARRGNVPLYEVTMTQFQQKLHAQLPPTTLWGYDGNYLGATFETRRGQPIAVEWMNNLPTTHLLPIDHTIHGADAATPAVRTVVHLHGAKVLPDSDGYPEAWFTNAFAERGPFFSRKIYYYPNDQQATTLWYHDHTLGITRLNLYTGLEGFYLIRDEVEDCLGLPKEPYEIPLMIQDRMFAADGSLLYPVVDTGGDPDPNVPPIWIPEFFGDTVLVNGKVWPYLEVEPRKYRFRILNAANARFWHLTLNESNAQGKPNGRRGPAFFQIGTDGGFLPAPVKLTDMLVAPAERHDVIIDFSGLQGKHFVLQNDAPAPFPGGDPAILIPSDVMLFRVTKPLRGPDSSSLPARLADCPLMHPSMAVKHRDLTLTELESADPYGNPIMSMLANAHWDDPVTENPKAGTIEVWNLFNLTGDAHSIHVHLVQFQVLARQALLTDANGDPIAQVDPRAPLLAPDPNERPARKDTVKTYPGYVTRIIAKFDLPTGTRMTPGQRFRYVWHCHMLEHEDNEMMRPYDVVG